MEEEMNIILIYFAIKYQGDWDLIYKALDQKEKVSLKDISELEEKIKVEKWNVITLLDIDYPKRLKEAYKPPFVLWYQGNKKMLDQNLVSFTGNQVSTRISDWISTCVPEILETGSLVLSGHKGVEQEVAKASSEKGLLYIQAAGLDKLPSIELKESDLVITEYPYETNASSESYRNRNRLIAALSQHLILVSSEKNGKINNLISQFLNLGKDIYCFPGDGSENDGNSELIKQGASLITTIKDIVD